MRIELRSVRRTYASDPPVRALRGVDLTIEQDELVAITGPSGSGKSTLLDVLALLDRPNEGEYLVDSVDVGALSESEQAWVRSRCFGFVFQSFHLMDRRSLVDNAELGLVYQGVGRTERRERAARALDVVGLGAAVHKPAGRMSGGERQRVAIARAVGAGAPVIVADEPTGNLDSDERPDHGRAGRPQRAWRDGDRRDPRPGDRGGVRPARADPRRRGGRGRPARDGRRRATGA